MEKEREEAEAAREQEEKEAKALKEREVAALKEQLEQLESQLKEEEQQLKEENEQADTRLLDEKDEDGKQVALLEAASENTEGYDIGSWRSAIQDQLQTRLQGWSWAPPPVEGVKEKSLEETTGDEGDEQEIETEVEQTPVTQSELLLQACKDGSLMDLQAILSVGESDQLETDKV